MGRFDGRVLVRLGPAAEGGSSQNVPFLGSWRAGGDGISTGVLSSELVDFLVDFDRDLAELVCELLPLLVQDLLSAG